jgi:arabinose-5-phosphate isomerase
MTTQKEFKLAYQGREVIAKEIEALQAVANRIGTSFEEAVQKILTCPGRVVLTGMGKHGLIARKIAATMASTGTPAFYMHPGEALHGDLGMIQPQDIVLALSNSGSTEEVVSCLPFFKRNGNLLIAMTGNLNSRLALEADFVLDIQVEREVCPLNLAPTTSTTAALAMGDALAIVLLEQRGFQASDFALRHPNGALGRQFKRVGDLMKKGSNPIVRSNASFREAIAAITAEKHGAVSIINEQGKLCGILTDGDLRRILQREAEKAGRTVGDVFHQEVSGVMTRDPLRITSNVLATHALYIMEGGTRKVLVLPVVDEHDEPVGMIHLHDLIG